MYAVRRFARPMYLLAKRSIVGVLSLSICAMPTVTADAGDEFLSQTSQFNADLGRLNSSSNSHLDLAIAVSQVSQPRPTLAGTPTESTFAVAHMRTPSVNGQGTHAALDFATGDSLLNDSSHHLANAFDPERLAPDDLKGTSGSLPDILTALLIGAGLILYQLCRKHRLLRPHPFGV